MTRRPLLANLAITACLFLAACSGAAGPATSGGRSAPGGGSSSPAASQAAVGGASSSCANPAGQSVGAYGGAAASMISGILCGMPDIDPCVYLDPATVQALFAVTLADPTTDHMGNCTWPLTDPTIGDGLSIIVNVGQGEGPLDQDMSLGGKATPISGIGDKASWELTAGYFPHLGAVKGDATCELTATGGNGQLKIATTGTGPLAAIDPAAVPAFMAKFGDLCNQIFAGLAKGGPPPSQATGSHLPSVDACSVLTPDQVQALFTATLAAPTSQDAGQCSWALSDPSQGGTGLTLYVDRSAVGLKQDLTLIGQTTPLSGVGDSAKWGLVLHVEPILMATKGSRGCELVVTDDVAGLAVATTPGLLGNVIDPSALPGFIQKMGDVCNEVFDNLGS